MKKVLLFSLALGMGISLYAQNKQILTGYSTEGIPVNKYKVDLEAHKLNPALFKNKANKTGAANSAVNVYDLGQAPNAYTVAFGPKTYVWADPNINTVTMSHRSDYTSNGDGSSGFLRYDVSTDGGKTWTNNVGPVYEATNVDAGTGIAPPPFANARYPQGGIYNPSGNTDASNAYFTYFAPTLSNTNGMSSSGQGWGGLAYGAAKIGEGNGTATEVLVDSAGDFGAQNDYRWIIPENWTITQQGKAWGISAKIDLSQPTGQTYRDAVYLFEGTWNGGTNEFDYNIKEIPAPILTESAPGAGKLYVQSSVAFAPDGQVGYLAFSGHRDVAEVPDSALYMWVYKTTDGGNTWSTTPSVIQPSALPGVQNALLGDSLLYTVAFEFDMAVDGNGDLHIITDVGPAGANFSIVPAPGFFGVFDISTNDGGNTWDAVILSYPMTFRSCLGDCPSGTNRVNEDSRPQIAMNYAGDKLFYVYFDTDTNIFGSSDGNLFPDAWGTAKDINTGLFAPLTNITSLTAADGLATFGNVSYYVMEEPGGNYCIPIVYQELLDFTDLLATTNMKYVDACVFDDAMMTLASPIGIEDPKFVVQNFTVKQNFPNPFDRYTSIEVTLKQNANDVTLEVFNAMGQRVFVQASGSLSQGAHKLNVDATDFSAGVYYYSVTVDANKVSRKMIVR